MELRYNELKNISNHLKQNKEFVKCRVNRGTRNYKSGSRLTEPYDLRNWMWLTTQRNNVNFIVSIQSFDMDPRTGNYHVLFDRVGIYSYVGEYSAEKAFSNMMITDIELPLNYEKLHRLEIILTEISDSEILKNEFQYYEMHKNNNLIFNK